MKTLLSLLAVLLVTLLVGPSANRGEPKSWAG